MNRERLDFLTRVVQPSWDGPLIANVIFAIHSGEGAALPLVCWGSGALLVARDRGFPCLCGSFCGAGFSLCDPVVPQDLFFPSRKELKSTLNSCQLCASTSTLP